MNTKQFNYPIDHIGIAVSDLDDSISLYTKLGFKIGAREKLTDQKVEICFIELENTKLELIASTHEKSSISKFISKKGTGIHHICYKVNDIRLELKRFKTSGLKLIDEIPRIGAQGKKIAFIHPKSFQGVLVELCE